MGLIDRIPDPEDLRSASVITTQAGREVDQQIKERRAAAVSRCMDMLPADRAAAVTDALPALEELAENLREYGRDEHAAHNSSTP
jgi:DNA-binding MarR family transcriptional regulator